MRRPRGFVYYDLWLLLVAIAVLGAIIVPAVRHARARAKLRRAEYGALVQIANDENDAYDSHHAYLDSLTTPLPDGIRLVSLRRDTAGWSAVVSVDSSLSRTPMCGVFAGPASLSPNPAVTTPSRIDCW